MRKATLTDSGFWFGLIDSSDQHHELSQILASQMDDHILIVPWPCLYEIVSTRLVRRRRLLIFFDQLIRKENIVLLDDVPYRKSAYEDVLEQSKFNGLTLSLVDGVLRDILKDSSIKIDFLATFNHGDFIDVCAQRKIEIVGAA